MLIESSPSLFPCDPHEGFSDDELVHLSKVHFRHEMGGAPWINWEVENSSFGKTFRYNTGYPHRLPIFACSDHGVHWESRCWPNELSSSSTLYLTWNEKKSIKMNQHGKHAVHIAHPWVAYRRANYPSPNSDRYGTVIFYPHSNSTTTPELPSVDRYFDSILSLPEKYHPFVICLSFHDILKGLHLQLRKYGIPIVTAGCTNSQDFVDRFYTLAHSFKFSTSPNLGSHSYYLIESSNTFFIYGDYPSYTIKGSISSPDGPQDLRNYGDEEDICARQALIDSLHGPFDVITDKCLDIVNASLGLNSTLDDTELLRLFWLYLDPRYFSCSAWLDQINNS